MNHSKPGKRESMREQIGAEKRTYRENTQTTHEHSTDTVQKHHEHSTDATQGTHERESMKRYDLRMKPSTWQRLGEIADQEGTSRGAIIRRLVREYVYDR